MEEHFAEMYSHTDTDKIREKSAKISSRLTLCRKSTERVEQEVKCRSGNKENEFTKPNHCNQLNLISPVENQEMGDVKEKIDEYRKSHHLNQLSLVNLENVISCIIERYKADLFYTYAGPILLSMNPCLPTTSRKSITDIVRTKATNMLAKATDGRPSVYSIGEKCLETLTIMKMDSTVVVTGDSGAGKTTATEQLLTYFLSTGQQSKNRNGLKHKIKEATSILEALGNACTISNPNSSRFGRFIKLLYENEKIIGAKIQTCLLQKHRVPQKDCQNFHIFYYIAAGLTQNDALPDHLFKSIMSGLSLSLSKVQNLLPDSMKKQAQETQKNCLKELKTLIQSFKSLGMMKEFAEVVQIVTGIMLLLSTQYIEVNSAENELFEEILRTTEQLFAIPEDSLQRDLTLKIFATRKSILPSKCSSDEIRTRVDSWATALYNSLFNYILERLNLKLQTSPLKNGNTDDSNAENPVSTNCISLLDLYGFENLSKNRLEQLCINYANEKLQITTNHIVNNHMDELKIANEVHANLIQLEEKGKERIRCIQTKIFNKLDDGNTIRNSSTEVLYQNLVKSAEVKSAEDNSFIQTKNLVDTAQTYPFTIHHYATSVKYELKEMMKQNTDKLPAEFYELFAKSTNPFVRELLQKNGNTPNVDTPGRKRQDTICRSFKHQVDTLISELESPDHETYFIKCLRPNETLKPGDVNRATVEAQLVNAGIEDILTITSEGLPRRISTEQFSKDFRAIERKYGSPLNLNGLFTKLSLTSMDVQLGKSKVFLSESAHTLLKDRELDLRKQSALIIQRALQKFVKKSKKLPKPETESAEAKEDEATEAEADAAGAEARATAAEARAAEAESRAAVAEARAAEAEARATSAEARAAEAEARATAAEARAAEAEARAAEAEARPAEARAAEPGAAEAFAVNANEMEVIIPRTSQSFETLQLMRVRNLRYEDVVCSQPYCGPVMYHTRATVLPFSPNPPRSQGLRDICDIM